VQKDISSTHLYLKRAERHTEVVKAPRENEFLEGSPNHTRLSVTDLKFKITDISRLAIKLLSQ
jgi:hypothetical protein